MDPIDPAGDGSAASNVLTHLRGVAFANIIGGGLGLALSLPAANIGISWLLTGYPTSGMGGFAGLYGILSLVVAINCSLMLIAGMGMLNRKPWARIIILMNSFVNLLLMPFGTLIGGYSIWVLFQKWTKQFLRDAQLEKGIM